MTSGIAAHASTIRIVRLPPPPPLERVLSTEGRVIYAIGDIHGRYDLLTAMLEAIVADIGRLARDTSPQLIFCGDYIDRGPDSMRVLSTLLWLSRCTPINVAFLLGNHEAMLLDFLQWPERSLPWLRRDAASTLRAYGVRFLAGDPDLQYQRLRDELLDRMPASHVELLRQMPTQMVCGDYVFVHAGLRPGVALARQNDDDRLWIAAEFLKENYRFEKFVIHGHSWCSDQPVVTQNRIAIDTGAYSTGVLTAVRLDGSNIEFMQARDRTVRTNCSKLIADGQTLGKA